MPYFDHNATTPLAPVAREAWLRMSEEAWQNPSSPYRDAARAKIRLDAAREQLAQLLACAPELIVFTSGATEAANAALAYWAQTLPTQTRVAINPTEHPCVLEPTTALFGERLVRLDAGRDGRVKIEGLQALLNEGSPSASGRGTVGGVIVMAANNETGVIQPWAELARLCRSKGVAFFCDAAQWLGKLPASGLGEIGWVIGAAHKFGGPKGVGFLKLAPGSEGLRIQRGGEQERSHRGGTEDVAGAVALVAALVEAEQKKVFQETERLRWRERFEQAVRAAVPGVAVVGEKADRLWNTVSLLMPHTENVRWVARLDRLNCQVSTGSACTTGKQGPSHVLAALGYAPDEARRVVRVSAGWETPEEDWNVLVAAFAKAGAELGSTSGNGLTL